VILLTLINNKSKKMNLIGADRKEAGEEYAYLVGFTVEFNEQ